MLGLNLLIISILHQLTVYLYFYTSKLIVKKDILFFNRVILLFIILSFLNISILNSNTLLLTLSMYLIFYCFINSVIINIMLLHIIFFFVLYNLSNILITFITLEFMVIFFSLIPLLWYYDKTSYEIVQLVINFLKWNLPTSILGIFIIGYLSYNNGVVNITQIYLFNNSNYYILIYFLTKLSVWPLFTYKNKIYQTVSVDVIMFINFQYFFLAQLLILPTIVMYKGLLGFSTFYMIFIIISLSGLIYLKNITKINEFILLTTYLTYINLIFIIV